MDIYILTLLAIGLLLLAVTLGSGWIERLPLSYALIYLLVGIFLGLYGIGLIKIRPDAEFLQRLTEFKDNNWQNWFKDWVAVDLIWAIAAGIVMGIVVAKSIIWLERELQSRRPVEELLQDFLSFSTILLTYSLTELVNGYGFVAVFVAGWMIQNSYKRGSSKEKQISQLRFIEQFEKLLEIITILILGSLLLFEPMVKYAGQSLLVAGLLFLVIRPLGVWLSMLNSRLPSTTLWLMSWVGIRGVGSLYYLTYAMGKGLQGETSEQVAWITMTTIALSVIIDGVSATPLMKWYERQ